ncbi:NAD-dependent epimerase/dehydratase family protein [Hydrogenophaga sp.]|uniref:NAD-dependent epimerase/dehydratase family protein n=1 Tax=Hydrogenophaga sp. TaxID=1904254 RepID=UPI003F715DC4
MTESSPTALIGHTGFVGGNLVHQAEFGALYNSRNIDDIDGKAYSHIVVTAAQARKWWANQNPQEDWSGIERLLASLARCRARQVTLISTIDVLGSSAGLTELDVPVAEEMTAYGQHRLKLEEAVRSQFEQVLVVRLPGLFGLGLKKNVIFDLLQHNALENINPRSSFQYYDLSNLWSHIQIAWSQKLELVHLFPAPILTSELIDTLFPGTVVGATAAPEAHYDHRTVHGHLFGGDDRYVSDKATVLQQLDHFIQSQRSQSS